MSYSTEKKRTWVWGCLFSAILVGCGGGSGSDPTSSNQQDQTNSAATIKLLNTTVSVADNVPEPVRQSVTQVDSLIASAKLGQPLSIPSGARGNTIVMASDTNGRVLLAGMTAAPTTLLDADTTAHALVRIRLGMVPEGRTVLELDESIRRSPSHSALVAKVTEEIATAKEPLTSEATLAIATDVISQTASILAGLPKVSAAASTNARLLPISGSRVETTPNPFAVLGSSKAGVLITRGGVDVVNTLPVVWSANTSSDANNEVLLPAASIQSALTLAVLNGPGPISNFISQTKTTALKNNGGKAYDLSVFQDNKSRTENTIGIVNDVMSFFLSMMAADTVLSKDCITKVVSGTFRPAEIEAIYASPSSDALRNYVTSVVKESTAGVIKTCFNTIPFTPSQVAEKLIEAAFKSVGEVISGKVITNTIGLSAKVEAVRFYSDFPKQTVGVCETQGVSGGYSIANCAVKFEIDPIVMAPGAETVPNVRAFDRTGARTAISTGVTIKSPLNGGELVIDEATKQIKAIKEVLVGVDIEDEEVNVKQSVLVEVVEPKFTPPSQRTTVGGSAVFHLKSPSGKDIILPKSGGSIVSLQPSIAEVNTLFTALFDGVSIVGRARGDATIQYTHPLWLTKPTATVTVEAPIPPATPTVPAPVTSGPSPTGVSLTAGAEVLPRGATGAIVGLRYTCSGNCAAIRDFRIEWPCTIGGTAADGTTIQSFTRQFGMTVASFPVGSGLLFAGGSLNSADVPGGTTSISCGGGAMSYNLNSVLVTAPASGASGTFPQPNN